MAKEVKLAPWSVAPRLDDVPVWTGRGWEAKQVREFVNQQRVWESVTGYGHGYLRLDCSNDPLTNSLEIEGNVNLNAAAAELQIEGDHALSLEDGDGDRTNVVIGSGAATGVGNDSFIGGYKACRGVTPINSTFVGYYCGAECDQGGQADSPDGALAAGQFAGYYAENIDHAVLLGQFAGGRGTNLDEPDAEDGVAIGTYAGWDIPSFTKGVLVGREAGAQANSLNNSLAVGYQAASGANSTASVFLGYQCGKSYGSSNNVLMIENSDDTSTPLVYGEFDNDLVRINGTLDVTGSITPGNVANDDTTPGIPVLFPVAISGGAAGDTDITIDGKHRVIDVWAQHTGGAGEASDTIQVKNGANAITDTMDWSGADNVIVRASSIDDANYEIADSGTLRVTTTDSDAGDDVGAGTVYVLAIPVA